MPEVNIQHLDKIYDGGVQAVYDFNLDVKDGEFIVLVGPSVAVNRRPFVWLRDSKI